MTDQGGEFVQTFVCLHFVGVAEVQTQLAAAGRFKRQKGLARHEGHALLNRQRQHASGVDAAVEGEPKEQATWGLFPGREIAKVALQGRLKSVTALAVVIGKTCCAKPLNSCTLVTVPSRSSLTVCLNSVV